MAAALATDLARGLDGGEAARRLAEGGPNRLDAAEKVPAWRRLLDQFVDPLVFLLIGAIVVSLAAWVLEGTHGVPFEAVVIGVIIVANAVLGYVQEARAEEAVGDHRAAQGITAPLHDVDWTAVWWRKPGL